MILRALVTLSLGGGFALCVLLYRRRSTKISLAILTSGLPDPDPLFDFNLVRFLSLKCEAESMANSFSGECDDSKSSLCQ